MRSAHWTAVFVALATARVANAAGTEERLHDGFFARSETGLALLWEDVSGSRAVPRRTAVRGVGQSASLWFGATPDPGLVLGVTAWTARIDPVFVEGGHTVTPDDDSVKVTFLRAGPFVDFYPDPSRGFHLQMAASFTAQVESDVKGNAIKPAAIGAALSIGGGYEWFVASQLSLGFLGRVSTGRSVREPSEGTERMLWIMPELALTATYH